MRTHTNNFKTEIAKMSRQIDGKIYYYNNYNLVTESSDTLLTENDLKLVSEQTNFSDKTEISSDLIYTMSIVKNGQLLQSLMKEFDFEAKIDLKVGNYVNPKFGVLINNAYEYLDYGNYVIYSKEYVAENQTWRYVCYDKMLFAMVQYEPLSLTYPCTIRQYISAIADKLKLTFTNSSDTFTNYDQTVAKELFENQNITYRDILDKLSEVVAGNIIINDSDELEIKYPTETADTIDEDNLKDINVNFGEKFGPINKVSITQTDSGYEYPAENTASINENGLTQVNIVDNIFTLNGNSNTIASNILTKLNGLYYYINDFRTTGVCYYDFLDFFYVSIGGNSYRCLLLNNEINITQGIEETIFTNKLENSEKENDSFKTSIISNKQVQFKINQQEGKIESKVEKDGVISAINQSAEQIQIQANKISLEGKTISMTSDNIAISSNNFSVSTDGTITSIAGMIGGWHIENNKLYCNITPPYDYSSSDVNRIQGIINGSITPTAQDYQKYDFYQNGTIELIDMQICQKLVYYNLMASNPGKLLLDTTDWFRPIKIINSSNEILASFGVNGVWTKPTS